MTSPS